MRCHSSDSSQRSRSRRGAATPSMSRPSVERALNSMTGTRFRPPMSCASTDTGVTRSVLRWLLETGNRKADAERNVEREHNEHEADDQERRAARVVVHERILDHAGDDYVGQQCPARHSEADGP